MGKVESRMRIGSPIHEHSGLSCGEERQRCSSFSISLTERSSISIIGVIYRVHTSEQHLKLTDENSCQTVVP